jgi:hypothetical protein
MKCQHRFSAVGDICYKCGHPNGSYVDRIIWGLILIISLALLVGCQQQPLYPNPNKPEPEQWKPVLKCWGSWVEEPSLSNGLWRLYGSGAGLYEYVVNDDQPVIPNRRMIAHGFGRQVYWIEPAGEISHLHLWELDVSSRGNCRFRVTGVQIPSYPDNRSKYPRL